MPRFLIITTILFSVSLLSSQLRPTLPKELTHSNIAEGRWRSSSENDPNLPSVSNNIASLENKERSINTPPSAREMSEGQYEANRIITTSLDADTGSYGNMFDIYAIRDLVITGIHFCTNLTTDVAYDIYTKQGTYYNALQSLDDWEILARGMVKGKGQSETTPILSIPPIHVDAGNLQALYITLTTSDIRYANTELSVGDTFQENDDIQLKVGSGISDYPFQGRHSEGRLWRGALEYFVWEGPSVMPSAVPSVVPSASPTVGKQVVVQKHCTDQLIYLTGEGIDVMDGENIVTFEAIIQDFLDDYMEGINITSVTVTGQNVTDSNFVSNRQRERRDGRLALETLIGATGPKLDFHTTVQETFESYEDLLIMKLKQSKIETLSQVNDALSAIVWDWTRDIDEDNCILRETTTTTTTPNTTSPVSTTSSEEVPFYLTKMGMVVIGICSLVGIAAIMCIIKYSIGEKSSSNDKNHPNHPNSLQEISFNRKASQRALLMCSSGGLSQQSENDLASVLADKYARQAYSGRSREGMDECC